MYTFKIKLPKTAMTTSCLGWLPLARLQVSPLLLSKLKEKSSVAKIFRERSPPNMVKRSGYTYVVVLKHILIFV